MPRNGAGTYTLPAGNPVVANTTITADWGNDTMEDVGNEITNSLSREGDGGMNAPLRFVDGDENSPGISWVSETNSGFYYEGSGEYWASVLGTSVLQFTAGGILIPTGIDFTVQGDVVLNGDIQVDGELTVTGAINADGGVDGNVTGNLTGNVTSSGTSTFTNVTVNTGLDMTNGIIANVATPIASADAANKSYVDGLVGGVTSVALSAPAVFSVGGSPITTSGTLALTYSGTALPEANGGTAQTTYTTGDLLYASGANTLAKLAIGTSAQVLKVTAGVPAWGTDSAGTGTVTSVAVSGGTTGLTTSGGPITTSGTITLAGTLAAANGGTGIANNAASTLTITGAFATTVTVTGATGVTLPTTGTLATLAGTETLTNKTLTSPTLTTPALGTPASGILSSCTVDGTDEVGFKNIPQNSKSAAYTLVLADAGKHIFHPSTDANARTFTIPANSSVAYAIGTALTFINMTAAVVTIAITTDTMYLSSAGTTGSRSLAIYGSATAIKMTSTTWLISGSGLT